MSANPVVGRDPVAGAEPYAGAASARKDRASYRDPRMISFGSIPARTFSIGVNGILDGGTGMFTMNTSP